MAGKAAISLTTGLEDTERVTIAFLDSGGGHDEQPRRPRLREARCRRGGLPGPRRRLRRLVRAAVRAAGAGRVPGHPTDPAGHGHSPAPSQPASIAAHARRCGALLRGLGVTRAHWVGHSSSCCIGLQLALDDPGLVASLLLFEPARPSGKQRQLAAATYVAPALAAAAQGDVSRAFDVFVRGVGGDRYREVLRARLGDDGLAQAEREAAYFFADELPALAAWTFGPAEAARVAPPALLLSGAQSRPWFGENVAILAQMLPNVRTETLPGRDHLAPLTHPAELAATIGEFLSHPAATPA
jgi:pimeloyl-ACP methyl ester carboxylesterase